MFLPSIIRSCGGSTPARARLVGKKSMFMAGSSQTEPAGITLGYRAIIGTRKPPS